jgi:hypothetical protein
MVGPVQDTEHRDAGRQRHLSLLLLAVLAVLAFGLVHKKPCIYLGAYDDMLRAMYGFP